MWFRRKKAPRGPDSERKGFFQRPFLVFRLASPWVTCFPGAPRPQSMSPCAVLQEPLSLMHAVAVPKQGSVPVLLPLCIQCSTPSSMGGVRTYTGVFSERSFFSGPCPADPTRAHTCPGITWRLCGGLGASVAHDLRALRLWQSSRQWCAMPWSCIDAAPGCRRAAACGARPTTYILTAWPGRVAQALRAGRSRTPWSCSPCWRLCREAHG